MRRETGTITGVNSDTVEAWLDHWLPNIAARRVRERTLESYESMIRMHITPHIGGQRLDRLQPEHLEQLYNLLLEQGLSPTTVLRVHRIISRALKVAMQRQRIHRNVATLVDPPAQRMSEVATALTLEEATAVLHTAQSQRNAARWTVALALGLRQSEALALQWKDIDLLNGTLTVRRTLHRVKGKGLVYEPPKTKRSMRTLALPVPLVRALHEHKARQTGERMLAGQRLGRTRTSSSPSPTADRSTRRSTTSTGATCCARPASGTCGCTTAGTPRRRCCCPRACIPVWSWSCSATRRCAPRWTSTATSCPPWPAKRPTGWAPSCSAEA